MQGIISIFWVDSVGVKRAERYVALQRLTRVSVAGMPTGLVAFELGQTQPTLAPLTEVKALKDYQSHVEPVAEAGPIAAFIAPWVGRGSL
jgi:hypothetical protein